MKPTIHTRPLNEWVRAARAGEDAAWTALYSRYQAGMYAIALRICGDRAMAQDALQDAFVTAYLKLAQLTDVMAFGGWLKQIVIHTCYRALGRLRSGERLDDSMIVPDGYWEDTINQTFDQLATQNRLYTALGQLPDVLRSTVLLRYFSAFQSYEAIAAILGVPVGTVRSRLNQARLKLTEQWYRHPDADDTSLRESQEWNAFYHELYTGLHQSDRDKNELLNHLHKHVSIIRPGGATFVGSALLDDMVAEDRAVGSWLKPVTVLSSATLSIVEVSHVNSSEHPDHCPAASVIVLYRDGGKVRQMRLHTSAS